MSSRSRFVDGGRLMLKRWIVGLRRVSSRFRFEVEVEVEVEVSGVSVRVSAGM